MEPTVVTGSVSPNGNLEAVVEQDDRCAYLYLREADPEGPLGFGVKSCWVRNLRCGPASMTQAVADMRSGLPPMMPADACAHPEGAKPLSEDGLRIVWFEEGDAAALVEGDSILAIVPCWSGQRDFWGYARDCTKEGTLAWPLAKDNALIARVGAAEECWRAWDSGDPWSAVQGGGVKAIEAAFGPHTNYYAIDGGQWPPRALVRCAKDDAIILVTCGMQLRPQPTVELFAEDPGPIRRIELGLAIARSLFDLAPRQIMGWLSGQSQYPWSRHAWFGHHHTMPCDAMPAGPSGSLFDGMLFLRDPVGAPQVAFEPFRGDPVSLLWLVPIGARERELAEREGSAELARRLADRRHGFVHRDRSPVA